MLNFIRALIFNILFYVGSLALSLILLPALLLPQHHMRLVMIYTYYNYAYLVSRYIMGIKLEIRGLNNLPKSGAFILASKHQSAYETLVLPIVVRHVAIILKKELTRIPVWGWYPVRLGMIPIDRGSATQAIRSIITGAQRVKDEQRPILIFPQGTRITPGEKSPYKGGLGKIYKDIELPIVPLALNAGVYWPKNGFIKKPGTVVFEFLPQIPAGLAPKDAMQQVEHLIESHSDKLLAESRT